VIKAFASPEGTELERQHANLALLLGGKTIPRRASIEGRQFVKCRQAIDERPCGPPDGRRPTARAAAAAVLFQGDFDLAARGADASADADGGFTGPDLIAVGLWDCVVTGPAPQKAERRTPSRCSP
jgi:hypothetical protein